MSNLTRIYADACNNPGKTDIVQPYTWLGLMASTDAQKDRYSSYRKMQISSSSKISAGLHLNTYFYRYHSQLSFDRCGGWQQRHFPFNQIKYCDWAKNEGYEGDNCARMQGNGIDQNRHKIS